MDNAVLVLLILFVGFVGVTAFLLLCSSPAIATVTATAATTAIPGHARVFLGR